MSRPTGAGTLVIVPTYNEKENIGRIVPAILAVLPDAHVLIVDDLSPDGTGAIADVLAADDARIHVVHRDGPRGLGRAYLHGFQWALDRDYAFIFEMDADFSHQPRYLPDFLEAAAGADLVLGCRYMEGGGIEGWGVHRLMLSRGGNRYARTVLGLPQRDLTGGFKCFRREVLEAMPLDNIESVGYCFQIELTWRAIHGGFRVAEVPIVFPDRTEGTSKMSMAIAWEGVVGVWKMRLGLTKS
ncbi:MAG: dolichol-phosphate mannosyltransferase [Myxococcota bacterium]